MVRLLRVLGRLSGALAGLLLLPWGAFALYAYAVTNGGGTVWSHPAVAVFLRTELTLAATCALLLGLAEAVERMARRKADSGGDK